jgi:membrane protein implicated in regulation of membrane protease activity
VNKKAIFRCVAGFLSLAFLAAGVFLLTPGFDTWLNKLNGAVFVGLAIVLGRYALTGKEKIY